MEVEICRIASTNPDLVSNRIRVKMRLLMYKVKPSVDIKAGKVVFTYPNRIDENTRYHFEQLIRSLIALDGLE